MTDDIALQEVDLADQPAWGAEAVPKVSTLRLRLSHMHAT